MAAFATSVQVDFSAPGYFFVSAPSTTLTATSSLIRLQTPSGTYQDYLGSFGYVFIDGYYYLSWPNSALSGLIWYSSGLVEQSRITGMSIPGSTYESYANANDFEGLKIYALTSDDSITGSSYADVLYGYAGNDTLTGSGGNDIIDGGSGMDTAAFSDNRDQYGIGFQAQGWTTIFGPNGADLLRNVELLQFADLTIETVLFPPLPSLGGIHISAINALDMSDYSVWTATSSHVDPGGTLIRASDGIHGQDMFGTGLNGPLAGGTIIAISTSLSGTPKSYITNLNLNAGLYDSYVSANNLQGLHSLVMAGGDLVSGSGQNDVLFGYSGNDLLYGNAGNDSLSGGFGNDTLEGGAGNDLLNGNLGLDLAVYSGAMTGYTVTKSDNQYIVTDTNLANGDDGTDILMFVERVRFYDAEIGLSAEYGMHIGKVEFPGHWLDHYTVADFNGDGKTDIWWTTKAGLSGLWTAEGGFVPGQSDGMRDIFQGWSTTDNNGDGRPDGAVQHLSGGGSVAWAHAEATIAPGQLYGWGTVTTATTTQTTFLQTPSPTTTTTTTTTTETVVPPPPPPPTEWPI